MTTFPEVGDPGYNRIVTGRSRDDKVRSSVFGEAEVPGRAGGVDGRQDAGQTRAYHTTTAIPPGEILDNSDLGEDRSNSDGPLKNSQRTRHLPNTRRRFSRTPNGTFEPISRFYRLSYDGIAHTLRAGTGPDRGSHTAPRPIHPEEPRCITVREAARLHSFPDWFVFDRTIWHGFMQVGNSVPPLMARAVAIEIMNAVGSR